MFVGPPRTLLKRLADCSAGELVCRLDCQDVFEIAIVANSSYRGLFVTMVKSAARHANAPYAALIPDGVEVLSLGRDWFIEPVGVGDANPSTHGTLSADDTTLALKLTWGSDEIDSSGGCLDLRAMALLGDIPPSRFTFAQWDLCVTHDGTKHVYYAYRPWVDAAKVA